MMLYYLVSDGESYARAPDGIIRLKEFFLYSVNLVSGDSCAGIRNADLHTALNLFYIDVDGSARRGVFYRIVDDVDKHL